MPKVCSKSLKAFVLYCIHMPFLSCHKRLGNNRLPVVVDVTDNDGQQTEKQDDGRGIDDRVQGLDAGREILHAAEVLQVR